VGQTTCENLGTSTPTTGGNLCVKFEQFAGTGVVPVPFVYELDAR
jgi:hypothetical protein